MPTTMTLAATKFPPRTTMLLSAPILPLCTSPQGSDEGDEEEDYENGENINNNSQEGEDTGQTQK